MTPGPQGPTGSTGSTGSQGPTGTTGSGGAQGPTGSSFTTTLFNSVYTTSATGKSFTSSSWTDTISISINSTGRYLIGASFEWTYSRYTNIFAARIFDAGSTNYNHPLGSGYLTFSGANHSSDNYRWGYYRGYLDYVQDQMQTVEEITATKTIKLQFRELSSYTLTTRNIILYAIKLQDSAGSGTVGTTSYSDGDDGS